jgi:hypothetical protein
VVHLYEYASKRDRDEVDRARPCKLVYSTQMVVGTFDRETVQGWEVTGLRAPDIVRTVQE